MLSVEAANTKAERSRTFSMSKRLREELIHLWEMSAKAPTDVVFGFTDIKKSWRSACTKAAIKGLRFHDLRHTATTRFVPAGMPLSEAMKIKGHSQLRHLNVI
ncbi:MAG: tyrosine-type recombinase/integrase [Pyrinomonadaceae bacterium]